MPIIAIPAKFFLLIKPHSAMGTVGVDGSEFVSDGDGKVCSDAAGMSKIEFG